MYAHHCLRSYKCVVELSLSEVSAPGTRLANKEDLYLNICLLGQQRRTRTVPAQFPLKFSDNLIFEKTFKCCHGPCDVVNFLGDLHVLIELIQLGRSANNEVIARYESNVRNFLYPSLYCKPTYHSAQRDVFMTKTQGFPGHISPQIIFCTFTNINETQTPSLDILKEYENRFVNDPLIEIKKEQALRKKHQKKQVRSGYDTRAHRSHGILRHDINANAEFANHTISSAIKADYTEPDVKQKINELNGCVKKKKIVKNAKGAQQYRPRSRNFNRSPFVVRHVDPSLTARRTELHDMLHDGLVLTNKNPDKIYSGATKRRSRSLNTGEAGGDWCRLSRSLSPQLSLPRPFSLNRCLNEPKDRSRGPSRSRSRSAGSGHHSFSHHKYEFERSPSPSNCEARHDSFSKQNSAYTSLNNSANTSGILNTSHSPRIDPLNERRLLKSDEFANRLTASNGCGKKWPATKRKKGGRKNNSNVNASFVNCSTVCGPCVPPCEINWRNAKYCPWLCNYSQYLKDLDEELYWLRVRSKYLSPCC